MKAAALVLAVLLVVAHPAAAMVIVAVELAACGVLGVVIVRALHPLTVPTGRQRRTP